MITLENLTYFYSRKSRAALTNINASIPPGIHLLLGENGAGKTTLLNIIDGALIPSSGRCLIDGTDTRLRSPSVSSRMVMMSAAPSMPLSTLSQMERYHAPFYPGFSPELLRSYADAFHIGLFDKFSSMSLGTLHKAAIAYVLSLRPDILLMDEPANGLDIESKETLSKMLTEYGCEGRTLIVSTHTISDLATLYDSVIVMEDSHLLLAATTDHILDRLSFFGSISVPQTAIYYETSGGRFDIIGMADDFPDAPYAVDYRLLYHAIHSPASNRILEILQTPSSDKL